MSGLSWVAQIARMIMNGKTEIDEIRCPTDYQIADCVQCQLAYALPQSSQTQQIVRAACLAFPSHAIFAGSANHIPLFSSSSCFHRFAAATSATTISCSIHYLLFHNANTTSCAKYSSGVMDRGDHSTIIKTNRSTNDC